MHDSNAIVIGSGVAVMAAAIRLAIQGFSVKVFEKNEYPGGKLSLLEKDGYRFDAGPSLFTRPDYLEQLFADAEENISDYFQYRQVPLSCRYFFENGKIIDAWTDIEKYESELIDKAGEQAGVLESYLNKSERLYNSLGKVFLNNSLHQIRTWLQPAIPKSFADVRWNHVFDNLHNYNKKHFT